jgi:PPM family protein phosphatase
MQLFAAATHAGHRRDKNEDCYAAKPACGLWLVADGVGGHQRGEIASDIVARTISKEVARGASLKQAITASHSALLSAIAKDKDHNNMGSTVVALMLRKGQYHIGWVGDSRAYLWDDKLTPLTRDHNPVAKLLASGQISEQEASTHPQRHLITQCLGVSADAGIQPGFVTGKLSKGQRLLLCSDGLSDELSNAEIAECLAGHSGIGEQANALLEDALHHGGKDNITVIIVAEGADETPEQPGRE